MSPPDKSADDALAARLRAATELLEAVAEDRDLLGTLSEEERARLFRIAGEIHHPDPALRRQQLRARRRRHHAAKVTRDEKVLSETGIRTLRIADGPDEVHTMVVARREIGRD